MSVGKKIAHKAEATKGAVKKFFGRATGNTRLRTEGRLDQAKGQRQHQTGRGQAKRRLQTLTPPFQVFLHNPH